MSRVYYWSDPHFGHELVAGMRGFANATEHDSYLIDRWQATVTKRDTIWILGDLAMASPAEALRIIACLPGTKHLILGNHDNAHPMHRNGYRQQRRYLDAFDSVQTTARQRINGRDFLMSHFPYEGDHAGRGDRYTQHRLRDEGVPLIHGHVHEAWKVNGHQINVGVDHWMDGPASSEQIISALEEAS